ncbi:MAG: hypothetical protein GWP04_07975 [Gammaproteobacteria bacterium]|nr:hypothetical protein [Gammaproteobacteria bacterium]
MPERDLIAEARERRQPLHDAADALELVAAGPVGAGSIWQDRIRDMLATVATALADHIEKTEGPDGLYRELTTVAPRISNDIRLLTADHAVIKGMIEEIEIALDAEDVESGLVREHITQLLGRITRHRQKGADIVYEAYQVDIGGQA